MATVAKGPVATNTITDEYRSVEREAGKIIVQPLLELAPHPTANCERGKMSVGCRGLEFEYGSITSAKGEGENPSEWGSYLDDLKKVSLVAYNSSSKSIVSVPVAEYEYDTHGRLRAEWDPRISPALKTTYGYDVENHVTALTSPGQQAWVFTYGAIAEDPSQGRLLKATQAQPTPGATEKAIAEKLHEQAEKSQNTELPVITGSPVVGVRMAVSNGKWTKSPVAYSYQWEKCYIGCTVINGATNQNYTPQRSDIGLALVVKVTALNGDGAVTASSKETTVVLGGAPPVLALQIGTEGKNSGEFANPEGIAADSKGNLWVADKGNHRLQELNEKGEVVRVVGKEGWGPGEFMYPFGVAVDSKNNVWTTDDYTHHVEEFNEKGEYLREFGKYGSKEEKGEFNGGPDGIAVDSKGNVWVASNDYVQEFNEKGEYIMRFGGPGNGHGLFQGIVGLGIDTKGNFWEGDTRSGENYGVQELNEKHEWIREFGSAGVGLKGELAWGPHLMAPGKSGVMWITGAWRAREFNESGEFITEVPSESLGLLGVAVDPKGNTWVTSGLGLIQKWTPGVPTEGEYHAPQPGSTIDYNVPVSGTGAAHEMAAGEVEKWGQKDDPIYATAIFPPDEPQSWPATQYRRANAVYMDAHARTVNVGTPSGAITTTEYGPYNEVERTLSAVNRATALKEAKPAESAGLLDTKNKYVKEGSELSETTGPQHLVKLASGSEVQARHHVKYYYDEAAPVGEEYGLVTRTVGSALVNGKEEESRTTRTYYSGQKGLGWKLRQPTSVVTDPAGLDLTHTTVYNEATGDIVETKNPGGTAETVYPPAYSSELGTQGSGNGQLNEPLGTAIDASGDLWVDNNDNNRIEEFSPTGTVIGTYGSYGSGEAQLNNPWGIAIDPTTGNVLVCDTGNNRVEVFSSAGKFVRTIGSVGTGNGQLKAPNSLTVDSHGNIWIADYGNNRVEEFSSAGTYISQFGSSGTGSGQFNHPVALVISEGELFVVDHGNDRIDEFTPAGTFLATFGQEGTSVGKMEEPEGIAVDPMSGNLYVSDQGNQRVDEFSRLVSRSQNSVRSVGAPENSTILSASRSTRPATFTSPISTIPT